MNSNRATAVSSQLVSMASIRMVTSVRQNRCKGNRCVFFVVVYRKAPMLESILLSGLDGVRQKEDTLGCIEGARHIVFLEGGVPLGKERNLYDGKVPMYILPHLFGNSTQHLSDTYQTTFL